MQLTPLCTPDVSVKQFNGHGMAVPVRCKRWSCPECAKRNKRRVIQAGISGQPRALLTLTVSSKNYDTPTEAAHALKRGLRLLRLHLKRHEKLQNFEYLAVFEEHKSGYPHMHLLITGKFIPWQWLRTKWEQITGSTHIHIRKIRNTRQAANYTSKYISKGLAAFEGCKRWWRSHGYPRPNETVEDDMDERAKWGRYEIDFHQAAINLALAGYKVERVRGDRIVWHWPEGQGEAVGWQWAVSGGYSSVRRVGFG